MFSNETSDDFLDNIKQDVPLKALKEVIQSCYFDENLTFCAVLSRVHDDKLKEMLGGNFLFELWFEGELLYQKPLKNKVRAWNQTRQDSSIIFLLDKEDE